MLPLKLLGKGKVRDVYDLGEELLIVTSDRISAFDYVLPTKIDNKGKYLTKISVFWFNFLKDIVANHFITAKVDEYPKDLKKYKNELENRSMLVRKAKRINIECIVRGYIAGSGFKEYENFGTICGIKLPMGLKDFSKLVEPIFTPSTKAEIGNHDINISEKETIKIIGEKTFNFLKEKSIALYKKASECALEKGIIIADTKFEFGFIGDEIILIDEILTPDSSRFWDLKNYQAGKEQNSFDKQIIRDYLEKDLKWNKTLPIPELSKEIVKKTISQYEKICNLLING